MPRKTRILHGDDEYLFVEAPGDAEGPALLIFARPENRRAVGPGRTATHKSEHGLWVPVARFDGRELQLPPDRPDGLDERLKGLLPRYVEARRTRDAQAKNALVWISAQGRALHSLHLAQPSGLLLKLWRSEEAARRVLDELREPGSVQSTGELREFLELRAEEGFAGALLDPGVDEAVIFYCLDEPRRLQFMKVSAAPSDKEVASHLLDDHGIWRAWEGDEALDPHVDPEGWDRLMVRTFGRLPFLGYRDGWRCHTLVRDRAPATFPDPEGEGATSMVALFHDPQAADAFRSKQRAGRATIEQVADLVELVRSHTERGIVARLHPGDHRVRGGTIWLDGASLVLDGFAGIWRSSDGRSFEPAE